MVELIVRLCVALGVLGLGLVGVVPFDVAWKAAIALAAVSLFGSQIESKGLMNSGVAGFFAVGESIIVALFLAGSGSLHDLGFLVLIPCIYAGARYSAPMTSMAPLSASAIVGADCLYSKSGLPAPQVLFHAAGVLSVSLLLGLRRPLSATTEEGSEEHPPRSPQLIEDGVLQLRENFRKLRDAYNDLERRSQRDKIVSRIAVAQDLEGEKFYAELCAALRELSHAEEIGIYTLAQFENVMVVRGVSEQFPGDLKDHSIDVDVAKAPIVLREQAEASVRALAAGTPVANVLLIHKGKIVGMVCAIEPQPHKLDAIRMALAEAAPTAAKAIDTEVEREANIRRVKELELLYEISSLSTGAITPGALAGRVTREIVQSLHLDSVRVALLEKGKEKTIANEGSRARMLDCIDFDGTPGVKGWLAAGSPEIVMFDVRQDPRCDREETFRRRIGGFVLAPLWAGAEIAGYLAAGTQVVGELDRDQIGTLRLIAAEMSRALERLQGTKSGGLMTPREFADSTADRTGTLVYLEPLRREQLVSTYGYAPFEEAVRKLAHQVRAKLPGGACMCRRNQGDFLVFLDVDEDFARKWANEVTASASLIAISTSDPTKRVPLALRARVALLTTQSHQLSEAIPA